MKSRRGNIQKQSGTESIHVSQFGFTRTDVRLIVVERPSMTRHESIGTRRRAKGGRGWCIVIRVTIIVGKNPGRDANNEVALIRGGGDLPEYRARNKNPVAPNDVRTFHTDFSLSLSFILYFSFFFFFRRGVPLHAMRTRCITASSTADSKRGNIYPRRVNARGRRPTLIGQTRPRLVIGRAYLFFIA